MRNTTRRLGVAGAACLLGLLLPTTAFAQAIPSTSIVERKPEGRATRDAAVEREDGRERDALERETLAALQKARRPKQDADLARSEVPAHKSAHTRRVLGKNLDDRLKNLQATATSDALARGESNKGLTEFVHAHVATDEKREAASEERSIRYKGQNDAAQRRWEQKSDFLDETHERKNERRQQRLLDKQDEKAEADKEKKDEKKAEDQKERLDERKDVKDEAKKEQKEERTKELRDEKQREQTDERRTSTKP